MRSPEKQGDRPNGRSQGFLFLLGAVAPSLWAIWVLFVVGISNSPIYGAEPQHRYPRDVPELWVSATILTLTAIALTWIAIRRPRLNTILFATLASFAAVANWALLLLVR